jgi:hypothetical protein
MFCHGTCCGFGVSPVWRGGSGDAHCFKEYRSRIYLPAAIWSTPALFGFSLFMLGASWVVLYLFAGLSAVGMLYHRSRMGEVVELLRKEKGGKQEA